MFIVWGFEKNFKAYVLTALIGFVAEAVIASFGICKYIFPDILGIPYWIPFLWGVVGLLIVNTCKKLSIPSYEE